MPRRRKMTWQAGSESRSGRWRKKYKKRVFQAAGGRGKNDDEAYQKAWEGFKQFKDEVDKEEAQQPKPHQAEYEAAIAEWKLVLQWSVENGDVQYAPLARSKIEALANRLEQSKPQPLGSEDRELVIVAEGASDTAAALDLGWNVIGRPSADEGASHLIQLLKRVTGTICVLADNDMQRNGVWTGRRGAETVAKRLKAVLRAEIMISNVPTKFKDVRDYVQAQGVNQ